MSKIFNKMEDTHRAVNYKIMIKLFITEDTRVLINAGSSAEQHLARSWFLMLHILLFCNRSVQDPYSRHHGYHTRHFILKIETFGTIKTLQQQINSKEILIVFFTATSR